MSENAEVHELLVQDWRAKQKGLKQHRCDGGIVAFPRGLPKRIKKIKKSPLYKPNPSHVSSEFQRLVLRFFDLLAKTFRLVNNLANGKGALRRVTNCSQQLVHEPVL